MSVKDGEEPTASDTTAIATSNVLTGSGVQINAPIGTISQYFGGAENKEALCLRDLYITNPWLDKQRIEDAKGGLLQDSYRWILEQDAFRQWRDGADARLLWIKGGPGTGKTMLLCGVVNELQRTITPQGNRLAFFFCEAGNKNADSAAAVLRGLIYLLISQQPELIGHVLVRHEKVGSKLFEGPGAWYSLRDIFLDLLPKVERVTYFVVDALDGCGEDLERLLSLIAKTAAEPDTRVKWLVTSSRRADIARRLEVGKVGRRGVDLDDYAEELTLAVGAYVDQCAAELADGADDDLQQQIREGLRERAGGTFQYVTLAVARLKAVSTKEMPGILREAAPDTEGLYRQASDRIQHLDGETRYLCRSVLATIAIAHRPLRREELYALSGLPSNDAAAADDIIRKCNSFGISGLTTFSVDPQAREFLCGNRVLFPDGLESEHRRVFLRSLSLMEATLRRNMYGLDSPGTLAVDVKAPEPDPLATAAYACEYFIEHLISSCYHGRDTRDAGALAAFLESKYLYWVESLSLVRGIRTAVSSWTKLVGYLQGEKGAKRLVELVADAQRFFECNGQAIMERPLQAYASAVVFAPSGGTIGALVQSETPDWVAVAGDEMREEHWSPWSQTLEPGTDGLVIVGPVSFSPDGDWVAAALQGDRQGETKREVQVWDAVTGNRVWRLQNAGGWMAFPPKSSLLGTAAGVGAGGQGGVVRFWDLAKGAWHDRVIDLPDISAAAFSPDGVWLAAAAGDYMNIWDWERGDRALQFRHGSASAAGSVAYSADGTRLASAHEMEVRIWNAESGRQLCYISGVKATLVAFSPESSAGIKLISASNESLITWSTGAGERLGMLDVPSEHDPYSAVALSIDGRYFTASPGGTIKTWDTVTRRRLQTLEGYDRHVRSLVFSPDGRQLATIGAWGLRLYRAAASTDGGVFQATRDHPGKISIIRVSGGGGTTTTTTMVSASASTMKIWDLAVGGCRPREIETARGGILDVVLSPDGGRLVSLSSCEDVGVWDTETGGRLQTIPDYGLAASFSCDGAQVAILTTSSTLRVWDLTKKRYVRVFDPLPQEGGGSEPGAGSVAFAPDGCIATSLDRAIRLWKLTRRACTQTLGDDATAKALLFSSDAGRLAASYDDRIKIWDLKDGCCLQALDTRGSRRVDLVAFDASQSRLLTDVGLFLLNDTDMTPARDKTGTGTGNMGREVRRQGYGVDIDSGWVTWESKKMLWLPPAFRPDSTAVLLPEPGASTPSTIVLGCRSGRVVVLRFPTHKPPVESRRRG
ncbi:hypothetical protein GGTG_09875 [Gaeumannomyces tritici R3-111a-1]|uniref:Mitochondrial division protein 1 n=1 Tax=Gaeumannomyces tritici (strain R3-111a-1) TaxID=644352 RepID=J3P8P0_GAET3|nr:hypothetical protein GGTG_09875 [Gaeumannomyces tritici R3-111a-1]EJT73024.1 hypothetical protein GGTG_09875 [Gaeumannomyces tritici R3-111a-1]